MSQQHSEGSRTVTEEETSHTDFMIKLKQMEQEDEQHGENKRVEYEKSRQETKTVNVAHRNKDPDIDREINRLKQEKARLKLKLINNKSETGRAHLQREIDKNLSGLRLLHRSISKKYKPKPGDRFSTPKEIQRTKSTTDTSVKFSPASQTLEKFARDTENETALRPGLVIRSQRQSAQPAPIVESPRQPGFQQPTVHIEHPEDQLKQPTRLHLRTPEQTSEAIQLPQTDPNLDPFKAFLREHRILFPSALVQTPANRDITNPMDDLEYAQMQRDYPHIIQMYYLLDTPVEDLNTVPMLDIMETLIYHYAAVKEFLKKKRLELDFSNAAQTREIYNMFHRHYIGESHSVSLLNLNHIQPEMLKEVEKKAELLTKLLTMRGFDELKDLITEIQRIEELGLTMSIMARKSMTWMYRTTVTLTKSLAQTTGLLAFSALQRRLMNLSAQLSIQPSLFSILNNTMMNPHEQTLVYIGGMTAAISRSAGLSLPRRAFEILNSVLQTTHAMNIIEVSARAYAQGEAVSSVFATTIKAFLASVFGINHPIMDMVPIDATIGTFFGLLNSLQAGTGNEPWTTTAFRLGATATIGTLMSYFPLLVPWIPTLSSFAGNQMQTLATGVGLISPTATNLGYAASQNNIPRAIGDAVENAATGYVEDRASAATGFVVDELTAIATEEPSVVSSPPPWYNFIKNAVRAIHRFNKRRVQEFKGKVAMFKEKEARTITTKIQANAINPLNEFATREIQRIAEQRLQAERLLLLVQETVAKEKAEYETKIQQRLEKQQRLEFNRAAATAKLKSINQSKRDKVLEQQSRHITVKDFEQKANEIVLPRNERREAAREPIPGAKKTISKQLLPPKPSSLPRPYANPLTPTVPTRSMSIANTSFREPALLQPDLSPAIAVATGTILPALPLTLSAMAMGAAGVGIQKFIDNVLKIFDNIKPVDPVEAQELNNLRMQLQNLLEECFRVSRLSIAERLQILKRKLEQLQQQGNE